MSPKKSFKIERCFSFYILTSVYDQMFSNAMYIFCNDKEVKILYLINNNLCMKITKHNHQNNWGWWRSNWNVIFLTCCLLWKLECFINYCALCLVFPILNKISSTYWQTMTLVKSIILVTIAQLSNINITVKMIRFN